MMGYYGMGFGYGWFGPVFMLVFWAAIIYVAVWVFRQIMQKEGSSSPRDILERRYAKGEITTRQYQEMKKEMQR
ncbi:MAG TPA: hypothetical protein VJC16_03635 [Candidatus Nanoarchaeia archaeon]|nr:hypothetical protein [Candidatus Nanoarchaeia archaeon]